MKEQEHDQPIQVLTDEQGRVHEIQNHAPAEMTAEELEILARELTPVTGRGFMRENIYSDELFRDVHAHISEASRLIIARSSGKVSSYIASAVSDTEMGKLYHLGGIICEPQYQGSGIALKLLKKELVDTQAQYLGFHTQSKRMHKLGYRLAFLNISDSESYGHLIGSVNQQGIVDEARYGGLPLYQQPESIQIAIDDIEGLDFFKGDALICVGPIRNLKEI